MEIDFAKYYTPRPKAAIAHRCRAKYMLYGGSMGGGKSWFLCAEVIKNAMMFPGNRIVIVRKELSVIKRTILVSFFSICPPEIIKSYNQTSLEILFINGSVLTFIEANISKDPQLNKLKGLEIGFFAIDEANEVSEEVYKVLKTRLRWKLPNGQSPRYEGRLTSNPENCWLVRVFIQSDNSEEVYIQSLTTDNYNENDEYVLQLKEAFKDSPNLMRKYLLGEWNTVDVINQLIPNVDIVKCEQWLTEGYGSSIGVDVARFGDDRTVFTVIVRGNIEKIESHTQTSINEVVTRTIALMTEFNISPEYVGVDAVGIGAGVVDSLKALGYDVIEIIGGAKPIETEEPETFKPFNLRSQMYSELRKDIMAGTIGHLNNNVLKQELATIRYEIVTDKTMRVYSKEVIKKVLGKSPDYADSLMYANWVKTYRGEYRGALLFSAGD